MGINIKYLDLDNEKSWGDKIESQQGRNHFYDVNPFIREYLKTIMCRGALLDLGCGYGQISNIFNEIGFNVTGIDGDSQRISEAKLKYPKIDFMCYNIKDILPFEDNSFDVLFTCSVFQYLEHETILKECKRVLKDGGSIIMLENLKNNPITRLGRAYLKITNHNYHSYPWNHFTVSEIIKISKDFQSTSLNFFHVLSPLTF